MKGVCRALLLLMISAVTVHCNEDFALEDSMYSLECTGGGTVQYWMLHGIGQAYETGQTYTDIEVFGNGTLHFHKVTVEHEGDHLCVTTRDGVRNGVTVNMRVRPLPPQDLWEEIYKNQFYTGLIAAVICALLFAAGCLVFRYRYREPNKPELINGIEEDGGELGGHVNPAMEVDHM